MQGSVDTFMKFYLKEYTIYNTMHIYFTIGTAFSLIKKKLKLNNNFLCALLWESAWKWTTELLVVLSRNISQVQDYWFKGQ